LDFDKSAQPMSPEDLIFFIGKKFEVLVFKDLADLRIDHGSAFQFFQAAWKPVYEPDHRLVLFSQLEPEQQFLDHIQFAASRIDVSNFFILIICPVDISNKLVAANKKFGSDDRSIQSLILPLTGTKPFDRNNFYPINSLCPLPFGQLDILIDKTARPCCKFKGDVGNLQNSSISEVFYGGKISRIRQSMKSGQYPPECSICWHNERSGTTSLRQLALQKYGDRMHQTWLDDLQIRDITWTPTALCNFTCRICNYQSSTSIGNEEIKFSKSPEEIKKIRQFVRTSLDPASNDVLISQIENLSHIEFLHILGGEPMIWPLFPKLLQKLIDKNLSQQLSLEINTNCSHYPIEIIDLIVANFKTAEFLLSVDAIGDKFEIQRGGSWDKISENIIRFSMLKNHRIKVKLAVTINIQNLLYLSEIREFAQQQGLEILWWYLEDPSFLCIDQATDDVKKLVQELYHEHEDPELRKVSQRVIHSLGSNGKEFLTFTENLDQRRQQHFKISHSELYLAMGGSQNH
jgi:MoaA/NifB/PqqE/SkfB family radical SAM enzyme